LNGDSLSPRHAVFSLALLCLFIALVLCRLPGVVLQGGRFWAEEGVVYTSNALTLPWYDAWFAIHTGYLNLAAGFATWLALRLGGLGDAPLFTGLIALFIQCLPVYVICTHDFPWRRSALGLAAAVLACALPPLTGEVWLNTITSQFHLGLFAALVFAAPAARRSLLLADCAALGLAALSGPATVFLAPLFALAALKDRTARTVAPALIVLAGFCLQFGIYLFHIMPERGDRLGPVDLLAIVSLHTIVLPFTGFRHAQGFALRLAVTKLAGPLVFIAFNAVLGAGILRARSGALARLLAASILITLISFYEALDGSFAGLLDISAGQRYAFIAEVADALVIIGLASAMRGSGRLVFAAAAVLLLAVGAFDCRIGAAVFNNGPAWRPQVAAWRNDPSRALVVWPGNPWAFTAPER
jgi:hypothetical protein